MMDNSEKVKQVLEMVEKGNYFTINRPRQYGKTTTLREIQMALLELPEYLAIRLNFQGIDEKWHASDQTFAQMFFNELANHLGFNKPELDPFFKKEKSKIVDMNTLSQFITSLTRKLTLKPVLLIDEVDSCSTFEPFINFLGMLRGKYLERDQAQHATFHSIVLVGVHDIKTLKYKMRSGQKAQYNSPWNIATDFEVEMSFRPEEIAPMLEDYAQAEHIKMEVQEIAEYLYYHTSGYPFLVSKLCKTIAEKIISRREEKSWTKADIDAAVYLLMKENNTNFDSLFKNLENDKELYDLVYRILVDGENIPFSPDEPLSHLGRIYGIFKANGRLKIHNRIYEQRIYNYMAVKTLIKLDPKYDLGGQFITEENELDLEAVLLKFQQFMKEEYSQKDSQFLERNGRLVFLAYLNPILNGQGRAFKEVEVSEEKRLDVVINFHSYSYIVELKRWYGEKYHQRGIQQLSDYLDRFGLKTGYLLIFEYAKDKSWRQEWIEVSGKRVFAVWV